MAGVVTIDLTAGEAVGSFAELMDSTKVTMIAFGMDDREIFADVRNVDHLSIRVRVRNITVDAAGVTVTVLTTVNAHWRPVVVVDGTPNDVTIPGHVRVNFGSNSPLEGSDSMQSFWVNYYEGGTPHKEAQLLPHEWIGRHNQAAEPENGYIDNFMCGTTGATAVFNIPHTDLIGNNPQYRVWPSAERNYAHINNFQNQGVLIVANGADYNVLTPATRDPYAPVLRLTTIAGNVTTEVSGPITIITEPASTITINTYNADSPIAVANTITTYKDVGPASTDAITLTTRTDWVFYMDRAYHSTADEVYNSPLPQQSLQFGDDFRISGPAAIVPPFAGNNDTATREIYAERSALMNKLFDTPPLHTIYDALTERCRSGTTDDCQALYKNPYWFPIVGGVVTFDGLEITPSTTNADLPGAGDVRVVFPEPETTVVVGGDTVTIYAGSIIYPLRNEIHKANRLPTVGGYELVSDGEVIAYVDTSPAQRRLNYEVRHRAPQAFDSGIFNFAPTHAEGNEDCIVEPIGFVNPGPYLDLDLRAVARAITASVPAVVVDPRYTFDSDDDEDSALCAASPGANFLANTLAMGCYEKPVVGMTFAGEDAIYDTQNPYYFEYGVRDFRNNFEEFAWGGNFTNNTLAWLVDGADTHTNPIDAGFAGRNYTNEPIRYDGSFNRGHIADNDGLALLTNYYRGNEIFAVGLGYGLYGENSDGTTFMPAARAVQVPPLPLLSHNTDGRLKNPSAFQWIHQAQHFQPLGIDNVNTMTSTVLLNFSYATVGVSIETSGDEFDSLRLAHHINIPADTPITLNDYNPDPYPNTEDNFFTFPLRSTAIVINNDLATWESANPYIGLYRIGLEVDLLNTGFRRTIADNSDNEAFSRVDVSGKHVVHYQRSESSQSREPFSAVPIHTNVWLRLPEGGRLQSSNGGETIFLPPNSIVNPIYGTYLQHTPSVREAGFASTSVPNNYMTSAQAVVDLPIVRPALTLPAGGRLLVGMGGATIQNVQAAAFFSLTPLESVQCPTGTANAHDGQIGNPIDATRITVINQIREGVFASDDNYADAVTGRVFSFGHPCAWLDDPENMDGDRFFIYRGRRRYANDNVQVRPTSNDRTYLLGGRLEIGV